MIFMVHLYKINCFFVSFRAEIGKSADKKNEWTENFYGVFISHIFITYSCETNSKFNLKNIRSLIFWNCNKIYLKNFKVFKVCLLNLIMKILCGAMSTFFTFTHQNKKLRQEPTILLLSNLSDFLIEPRLQLCNL